jgi:DNA-binding transcriptional ArsR family regulator
LQSFADNNDNEDNDGYRRGRCDDDSDSDTLYVDQRSKHITPSQDAMMKHMADLQMHHCVSCVCWRDFKELNISHGTIRNNLSKLKEMELIEYSHKSKDAYYTLPKGSLQDAMTLDRLWVTKHELALLIKRLAFDTPAVHNIRLRFHCPTIYSRLRMIAEEGTDREKKIIVLPKSEDLVLPRETLENGAIEAGITVHRTNNVSVSLACPDHPIHFNIAGLVRLLLPYLDWKSDCVSRCSIL